MWREHFKIAFAALRSNWLRTLLTALSVSLGAGAIALMVSLSKSGVSTISAGIDAVGGRHIVFLWPREPKAAPAKTYDAGLTSEDAQALRDRVPGLADVAFMSSAKKQILMAGSRRADADVAIGSSYRRFLNAPIEYGTEIPRDQDNNTARVCMLTHQLAVDLFGDARAAVGGDVVLWSHRYRVVGVTAAGSKLGFRMGGIDKERTMLVAAPVMIKDEGTANMGFIALTDNGTYSHEHIIRVANAILLSRHEGTDDFEFFDFARMMTKFEKIFDGLRLLTGLIAAVSLVIAGAGIMNVLLASIKQRVHEIGMRRAIGASSADIRVQFLTESMVLAGMGGVIGAASGVLGTFAIGLVVSHFVPEWQIRVSWMAAAVAVGVSALCGLVFGLAPARRASRLAIVDCLRGDA